MSQPKVYEYAKEIGMETIALMDKIKEWKLPVKSHMATLSDDILSEIKARLDEDSSAKASKKKAVKKKTTKKKKAATKKASSKKAASKKATKKTTSKAGASKKATAKKKTVVRRKAATVVAKKAEVAPTPPQTVIETPAPSVTPEVVEEVKPVTQVEVQSSQVDKVAEPAVQEAETQEVTPPPKAATEEVPAVAKASTEKEASSTEASTKPKEATTEEAPAKPKRVKRNIVGKIDLSRVRPPQNRGNRSDSSSGRETNSLNRPKRSGARSVRTGFVAPSLPEIPKTDDNFRKSPARRRQVPGGGTGPANNNPGAGGAGGGKEQPVKSFTASDFRKREVIFQPKKKKINDSMMRKTEITTPKAHKRVVKVNNKILVGDLAKEMGTKVGALVKVLIQNGVMANMNTELDFDTVSLVTPEFGWEAENVFTSVEDMIELQAFGDLDSEPVSRAPVVTVMGHVDHGKTTLLDAIRKANVVSGEAGGITQHIGAYRVSLDDGNQITFLDTPGHAAFTAMRARGANITDIAIIVVAADDGIMPQTEEAISHAKAAGVPIIVAVNKMDKPQANPDQVKQQLAEKELVPEEWGGDTIFCHVSALKGEGISELLEQVHLVAEMQELKANPKRSATGVVIESAVKKGKGSVVTLLIQEGTLKVGEPIVVGKISGRVRRMVNDRGEVLKEAGPGHPVEVTGLSGSPDAGDRFDACKDDATANKIAEARLEKARKESSGQKAVSIEELLSRVKGTGKSELSIVLKTDVVGSIEAIKGMFAKIDHDEVSVKVIHSAVGAISESDVLLASTASGLIIGFGVRPDTSAQALAKEKSVEIMTYSIIYELMDDIKLKLSGLLSPDVVEKAMGRAEVRETFSVPRIGTIAGCMVADGKIMRNCLVRLLREGRVVYEGNISSLKRFKDDAKEVASGYECGIGIENYNDIKVGDEIEAYMKEEVARTLE